MLRTSAPSIYAAPPYPEILAAETGKPLIVPKGTIIQTTHPTEGPVIIAGRTYTVRPHGVFRGRGHPSRTEVCWAGTGGYWRRICYLRSD